MHLQANSSEAEVLPKTPSLIQTRRWPQGVVDVKMTQCFLKDHSSFSGANYTAALNVVSESMKTHPKHLEHSLPRLYGERVVLLHG